MKKLLYLIVLLPIMVIGQTTTENFIKTITYRDSLQGKPTVSVIYFDGLGRPIQQIAHQQSATGKDIITPIVYDSIGRQAKEYLPYTKWYGTSEMKYVPSAPSEVLAYYSSYDSSVTGNATFDTTTNPLSEKLFEASPLNRVLKQAAPGNDWALPATVNDPDHTIRFDFQTNGQDEVKLYRATAGYNSTYAMYDITLSENGSTFYPPNQLYKTITKNENWDPQYPAAGTTEEFKDKEGRVILKRTYASSRIDSQNLSFEAHDTYYVYDQFGNLTYVIPPSVTDAQSQLDGLCYQYKYDYRNRMVEKKLPGKQWEFIVYDKLDRVVATGPTLNPFGGLETGWMITKYDAFNRPVYTGWKEDTFDEVARRSYRDAQNANTILHETKTSPSTNIVDGLTIAYTNEVKPYEFKILTVNYFDDYHFPNAFANPTTVLGQSTVENAKGLSTGSWVRILTSSEVVVGEVTTTYYDNKKYRLVLAYTGNYLGGFTKTETQFAFDGLVVQTKTQHQRTNDVDVVTIIEDFEYSNQGRLINHFHTIDNKPTELLVHNQYDELGQLISKNVGGTDITTFTGLQKVNYSYNIRGWLTGINNDPTNNLVLNTTENDLFAFKINYNQVELTSGENTEPLYNGNIAQTYWRSSSDNNLRKYGYQYDDLNRLTSAVFMKSNQLYNSFNETLSYDKNGNINSLLRTGYLESQTITPIIDQLSYVYDVDKKNQLMMVSDATNSPVGFDDDSDGSGGDTTDYGYDDHGNMTSDQNKNISLIVYNHLNLPTQINFGTGDRIDYLYDATGRKVKKQVTATNINDITDYMNGFQYKNTTMEFFPLSEGYVRCSIVNDESVPRYAFNYVYNYTDHLGNIRLSYALDPNENILKIVEENHYYPFGLTHHNYNTDKADFTTQPSGLELNQVSATSRLPYKYKYNGKELQDELDLNVYDYGKRNYDPAIGRFFNIDRFAEKYSNTNPYHYTKNNPIYFVEVMGDSLKVNDNSAKTAVGRLKSVVNDALCGLYEVGESKTGNLILNSTGVGPMTKEQEALVGTLSEVMSLPKTVEFDAVDSSDVISQSIVIADNGADSSSPTPNRHTIDTEDMQNMGSTGLLTSQGALGHEFKEGFEMQQNGRSPNVAHQYGILAAENPINGTERISGVANASLSNPNITVVPVKYNGVIRNVTINSNNQQVTTLQNNNK
jgi:RHS repeat-associated protein